MNQLNMKTVAKRMSLLALSGAFVVGIAACGGGGSSSDTSSTTITGGASNGPIQAAIAKYNGSNVGSATGSDGLYSISITTPTTPVELTFDVTGATDTVTTLPPIIVPSTIVDPTDIVGGTTRANANTLTTLITKAAKAAAGGNISNVTAGNLTLATSGVLSNFGFGAGSGVAGFDPRTFDLSTLTGNDAVQLAAGFEAVTEMVRRVKASAAGRTEDDILNAIGSELSDGVMDGSGTDSALLEAASISSASVLVEVLTGSLKINKGNANEKAAGPVIAAGFSNLFKNNAAGNTNMANSFTPAAAAASFSGSTNAAFMTKAKSILDKADSLVAGSGFSAFASAFVLGTDTTVLLDAVNAAAGTVQAAAGTVQAAVAKAAEVITDPVAKAAADLASKNRVKDAEKASNAKNAFLVDTSPGKITLTDMAASLTTTDPSLGAGGVLKIDLPAVTPVNAGNLTSLAAGSSLATVPSVNFSLTKLPASSGNATVTMMLLDIGSGSTANDTRQSGERQISATYDVAWTSDGTTLTLTAPSTASVSYFTSTASTTSTAATATLSNASVGNLLVTTSGSNANSQTTTLKARIATLFSAGGGSPALASALAGNVSKGNYYYSVSIGGLPLADTSGSPIAKIAGTFTAM